MKTAEAAVLPGTGRTAVNSLPNNRPEVQELRDDGIKRSLGLGRDRAVEISVRESTNQETSAKELAHCSVESLLRRFGKIEAASPSLVVRG